MDCCFSEGDAVSSVCLEREENVRASIHPYVQRPRPAGFFWIEQCNGRGFVDSVNWYCDCFLSVLVQSIAEHGSMFDAPPLTLQWASVHVSAAVAADAEHGNISCDNNEDGTAAAMMDWVKPFVTDRKSLHLARELRSTCEGSTTHAHDLSCVVLHTPEELRLHVRNARATPSYKALLHDSACAMHVFIVSHVYYPSVSYAVCVTRSSTYLDSLTHFLSRNGGAVAHSSAWHFPLPPEVAGSLMVARSRNCAAALNGQSPLVFSSYNADRRSPSTAQRLVVGTGLLSMEADSDVREALEMARAASASQRFERLTSSLEAAARLERLYQRVPVLSFSSFHHRENNEDSEEEGGDVADMLYTTQTAGLLDALDMEESQLAAQLKAVDACIAKYEKGGSGVFRIRKPLQRKIKRQQHRQSVNVGRHTDDGDSSLGCVPILSSCSSVSVSMKAEHALKVKVLLCQQRALSASEQRVRFTIVAQWLAEWEEAAAPLLQASRRAAAAAPWTFDRLGTSTKAKGSKASSLATASSMQRMTEQLTMLRHQQRQEEGRHRKEVMAAQTEVDAAEARVVRARLAAMTMMRTRPPSRAQRFMHSSEMTSRRRTVPATTGTFGMVHKRSFSLMRAALDHMVTLPLIEGLFTAQDSGGGTVLLSQQRANRTRLDALIATTPSAATGVLVRKLEDWTPPHATPIDINAAALLPVLREACGHFQECIETWRELVSLRMIERCAEEDLRQAVEQWNHSSSGTHKGKMR